MITHFRQIWKKRCPGFPLLALTQPDRMTRLRYSPEWLETQQQFKKNGMTGWKHVSMMKFMQSPEREYLK